MIWNCFCLKLCGRDDFVKPHKTLRVRVVMAVQLIKRLKVLRDGEVDT